MPDAVDFPHLPPTSAAQMSKVDTAGGVVAAVNSPTAAMRSSPPHPV
jgi:hypothetical protein